MRICLLTNQDLEDLPDDDWPCDPRPYIPEATWKLVVLEKVNAVETVVALSRKRFDVFFNLCDGSWDEEDNPGIEVVQALERLNLPFTGGTSDFYEPSREAMKRVCHALDIPTPAYVMARTLADVRRASRELEYPLFVKHPSSYASIGLTRDSKVDDEAALLKQARIMLKAYGGALIEEFIEGEECTVLVAENPDEPENPIVYDPVQFRFPKGETFKHSDLKWVEYEDLEAETIADKDQDALLRDLSRRFFLGLNGAGYGRCDLRIDRNGRPYMLEINANCGLYYPEDDAASADFVLMADPQGHEGFTRLIIDAALKRHARNNPSFEVRPRGGREYGLFAARPIPVGQTILAFEGRPHRLVSLAHVEAHWSEQQRDFFRDTAWPVSDELWVAWSRDADEWKPISHSCDPNAWFDGLDIVARRRIKKNEEITLDYATFRNELMEDFDCRCDAKSCRGRIRGDDYLADFVESYDGHVSDYVRQRRARAERERKAAKPRLRATGSKRRRAAAG